MPFLLQKKGKELKQQRILVNDENVGREITSLRPRETDPRDLRSRSPTRLRSAAIIRKPNRLGNHFCCAINHH
jgi:hypothetical protein